MVRSKTSHNTGLPPSLPSMTGFHGRAALHAVPVPAASCHSRNDILSRPREGPEPWNELHSSLLRQGGFHLLSRDCVLARGRLPTLRMESVLARGRLPTLRMKSVLTRERLPTLRMKSVLTRGRLPTLRMKFILALFALPAHTTKHGRRLRRRSRACLRSKIHFAPASC